MKKIIGISFVVVIFVIMSCQESQNPDLKKFDSSKLKKPEKLMDRFSYLVGVNMGRNFAKDSLVFAQYVIVVFDFEPKFMFGFLLSQGEKHRLEVFIVGRTG